MTPPGPSDTAALEHRLARMKTVPLLLLAAMAAVFIGTHYMTDAAWVGYLRAFSEAAMVGALADWFAVVALFRHPLGLPIPHTAIIPRRKDELADSLADFVHRNFLTPEVISVRLSRGDPAAVMAAWLDAHRAEVSSAIRRTLAWAVGVLESSTYREFLRRNVFAGLADTRLAPVTGRFLALMAENRHHQDLFTEGLRLGISFLETHRESIRASINRGSPWWVPGFVDNKMYDQMVERIQTQLLAMVLDPDHELRQRFDESYRRFAEDLERSPAYARMLDRIRDDLLDNPAVGGYVDEAIERSAGALSQALEDGAGPFESSIGEIIERSSRDLLDDPDLRREVNRWLGQAAVYLVDRYGEEMTRLISDTVRSWDAADASRRIELQVGPDLQFIRINGTLVGGAVGLLIHAVGRLL